MTDNLSPQMRDNRKLFEEAYSEYKNVWGLVDSYDIWQGRWDAFQRAIKTRTTEDEPEYDTKTINVGDECICCMRVEDGIVTPNPDCHVHGGLHGKNPYNTTEDEPERNNVKYYLCDERKSWRNEITLQKIEEIIAEIKPEGKLPALSEIITILSVRIKLQQED